MIDIIMQLIDQRKLEITTHSKLPPALFSIFIYIGNNV
jgi:hypothetical protein